MGQGIDYILQEPIAKRKNRDFRQRSSNLALSNKKDGEGSITAYGYDGFDRLEEMDYEYTGDFELPIEITNPDVTYDYKDATGLVLSVDETIGGSSVTSSYTYDRLGRLKTYTPPVPVSYNGRTLSAPTIRKRMTAIPTRILR